MADDTARLRRLDTNLKNSFSKIREEIDGLKGKLEFQLAAMKDMKKELDDSKNDFVTVDKINILKIKIGDIMESLKAMERLDKKINDVQSMSSSREQTENSLDEIRAKLDSVEKKAKSAIADSKFGKLVREMNEEFSKLRNSVKDVEEKGGSIVKDRLGKLEQELNRRIFSIEEKLSLLGSDLRKRPAKQEINQLLRSVNSEFDSIKEQLDDVRILRNDLKTIRRDKLNKASFEQQIIEIRGEMGNLKSAIENIRRSRRIEERKGISIYFIANILIALAFVLLGASLVLFFTGSESYMDYFIYGAIASFVLGLIMRVIAVFRGQ